MAILQLGAMVSSISGKIGGQTFVNGSQGTYLKNNGNVSKTPNQKQSLVRVETARIMAYYKTLTPAQLATFKAQEGNYTFKNRVGKSTAYTAFQIFMLLNQGRNLIGQNFIKSAPAPATLSEPVTTISDLDNGNLTIQTVNDKPSQTYVLFCTRSLSTSRKSVLTDMRKISVISNAQLLAGYSFTSDYLEVFPNLAPGQNIAYYLVTVDTASGLRTYYKTPTFFTTL